MKIDPEKVLDHVAPLVLATLMLCLSACAIAGTAWLVSLVWRCL